MNTDATAAGDRRRLAVCLLVAAALHAAVLLNIDFTDLRPPDPLPTIDLVLGQRLAEAPRVDDADVGSHTAEAVDAAVADPSPPAPASLPAPTESRPEPSESQPAAVPAPSVLADTTTHDLARAITAQAQKLSSRPGNGPGAGDSATRVRRLAGPPNDDPELAYYLDSWRRKVERVGTINYPSEARARGLSGTLRLLVVIDPDGELHTVRVLASSGHPLLDEGAVRIVNLAAPFSPFTKSMRARIDLLEIERTWRFRKDRLTPMP
ncbi:MAG: energy transducer TonB [Gammaproteobacteria bacterium]|nr:energy transducer TonB [Gammaproteobacteria bacterium]MXY56640.1 energy transducer TonB [Gammaproteobacteria bacterium]MYK46433.1 energy transducer TonB [Gammaproteobacteria bacterium]